MNIIPKKIDKIFENFKKKKNWKFFGLANWQFMMGQGKGVPTCYFILKQILFKKRWTKFSKCSKYFEFLLALTSDSNLWGKTREYPHAKCMKIIPKKDR